MIKFIIDNTEDRAEFLLQHLSLPTDHYKRSIDNVETIIQLLKNKGVTFLLVHKNNENAAELIQSLPESIWSIVYSGGGISESYSKSHIAAYKGVFDSQHKDEFLKIVDAAIEILDKATDTEKKIQEFKKLFGHDSILESKLNFLHHCLTPEGASKANDIENYDLIKGLVEGVMWGEKTVIEHLAGQQNCFDEDNYTKPLTKLRDALLS